MAYAMPFKLQYCIKVCFHSFPAKIDKSYFLLELTPNIIPIKQDRQTEKKKIREL